MPEPIPVGQAGCTLQALVHMLVAMPVRYLLWFAYRPRVSRERGFRHDQVAVLCANHRSFLDPPMVAVWMRYACGFFARASLWKLPVIGQVLRLVGGVPVDPGAPSARSIAAAIDILRGGRSLVIFPEGTRSKSGRLGLLREGPALIARRAGVPVVPVYVSATEKAWRRGWPVPLPSAGLAIHYGAPLIPPPSLSGREQDRWVTAAIRTWMHAQERRRLRPA